MAAPTVPSVALESRDQGEALLVWDDTTGETSYRVERSGPGARSDREFRNYNGIEEGRSPWRRRVGQPTGPIRRELSAGDGVVLNKVEDLAAGVESTEHTDLEFDSEYCYRVRSVNSDGESPSELDCLSLAGCSTAPSTASLPFPRNSVSQLSQAVERAHSQIIANAPCVVCPVDGTVELDLSKCANFIILVDQDICSIKMYNSRRGRYGCFTFAFYPCADDIQRRLGGFPLSFGFTGGECNTPFTQGCSVEVCWRDYGDGPRAEGIPTLSDQPVGAPGAPMAIICPTSGCLVDCAAAQPITYRLSVRGGQRPYTWTTTYGEIEPLTAAHDEVAILTVHNTVTAHTIDLLDPYAFIAYICAKSYCDQVPDDAACAKQFVSSFYYCDDVAVKATDSGGAGGAFFVGYEAAQCAGTQLSIFQPFSVEQCINATDLPASDTAMQGDDPLLQGTGKLCTSDTELPSGCIGTRGFNNTDNVAAITGRVTPQNAQYTCLNDNGLSGCKPCGFIEGAVITVTDATGKSVSKVLHANMSGVSQC